MTIAPKERIGYAGRWWRATDESTMKQIADAIRNGEVERVCAAAVLDGRLKAEEESK